jgi:hypothetical protein
VVKPGGRIGAVEPDLEVVLLDSAMVEVTRRVLEARFRLASQGMTRTATAESNIDPRSLGLDPQQQTGHRW